MFDPKRIVLEVVIERLMEYYQQCFLAYSSQIREKSRVRLLISLREVYDRCLENSRLDILPLHKLVLSLNEEVEHISDRCRELHQRYLMFSDIAQVLTAQLDGSEPQ